MSRIARLAIVASLGLSTCLAATSAFAQAEFVGTWALNSAKSKGPPGAVPDSITVVVSDVGGGKYKSVSDSTMAGANVRSEITFAVDGKEYAPVMTPEIPGAPPIVQTCEKVSDSVYKTELKIGGQVIATTMNEISADGKVLTMTTTGVGQFAAASSTMVFDRK